MYIHVHVQYNTYHTIYKNKTHRDMMSRKGGRGGICLFTYIYIYIYVIFEKTLKGTRGRVLVVQVSFQFKYGKNLIVISYHIIAPPSVLWMGCCGE